MNQQLSKRSFLDKCIKDKDSKIVIAQRPNLPILIFVVCFILSKLVSSSNFQNIFSSLGTLFLFAWAWLEISSGVNYFRRFIGAIVIAIIIFGIIY